MNSKSVASAERHLKVCKNAALAAKKAVKMAEAKLADAQRKRASRSTRRSHSARPASRTRSANRSGYGSNY